MVRVLSDLENEWLQQVPFDFMPEGDTSKLIGPWYGTKEARIVAGYDPEKEIVVGFIRKSAVTSTEFDCSKIQTKPTPPVAAEGIDS